MIELTIPDTGKKYKIGLTRMAIKQMIADGFDFSAIQNPEKDPITSGLNIEELLECAFKTYNPKLKTEDIVGILNHYSKEDKMAILNAVMEQFNNSLSVLIAIMSDDDDGAEKNGLWKVI